MDDMIMMKNVKVDDKCYEMRSTGIGLISSINLFLNVHRMEEIVY